MIAAIILAVTLAVFFGIVLELVSRKYSREEDPKVQQIYDLLPHLDCGACGYAGCMEYAKKVCLNCSNESFCKVGGTKVAKEISKLLGKEMASDKEYARINCVGGRNAKDLYTYEGPKSCRQAMQVGSFKECQTGCLGFGDCVNACKFNAIKIGKEGYPVVSKSRCTACGACENACPQKIITIQKSTDMYIISCSSHDINKTKGKYCATGCIACGTCVRVCPVEAIKMINHLPVIDYEICIDCGICAEKCPRKVIIHQ